MQLPGMSTEPVRIVLEVTWWPSDDRWGIARKGYRCDQNQQWRLEEMACSGTPLTMTEAAEGITQASFALSAEILNSDDPFGTLGAFH